MNTEIHVLVTTFPDRDQAHAAAELLVAEDLAVCAQVGADLVSFYRWRGEVQRDDEVQVTLKVRRDRLSACADRLRHGHPYEVPQILAWPASYADSAYLAWAYGEDRQ